MLHPCLKKWPSYTGVQGFDINFSTTSRRQSSEFFTKFYYLVHWFTIRATCCSMSHTPTEETKARDIFIPQDKLHRPPRPLILTIICGTKAFVSEYSTLIYMYLGICCPSLYTFPAVLLVVLHKLLSSLPMRDRTTLPVVEWS
jgi:hypothetical protein